MEGQWGCSRRYLNAFTGSTDISAPQTGTAQICLCAQAVWCRHNFPACCSHEVAQVQLLQVEHQDQRSAQRWASRGTALPRALPRAFCHVLVRTAAFHAMCFLRKCCTPKQAGVSSKELPLTSSLRTMSPSPSPSPCAARPPLDHRITES